MQGNRILLKPIDKVTDEYENWINDPEVTQYMETARSKVLTRTELERWLEKTNNDPDMRYWGIFITNSLREKFIGTIKLHINWIHRHADIGIMIGDKTEWGKGYATEAIGLVKDYAFNILGLHRLWAGIYESNLASIKAFEKNGFSLEGYLYEHRFCNGKFISQYIMGIVNDLL